ncbi:endonuclease [Prevotella copri]|uniref:UPF0102 protein F7D95_02825 n=1 Tax=Segatella copri TaxID=165179 RepID=A0AA90UDI8_9BACT|nr:YraN family protein [Segatella copri]MQN11775.1 endonuclease [Segatella copri]
MAEHNDLGKWGEDEAVLYLEDEGYTIIDRDWRLGRRDLDILAYTPDGNTLVVVEVKTRTGEEYQQPEEAVTPGKMRNLAIAANAYVKKCQVDKELRFDVISIVGSEHQVKSLLHLKDAFNPMLIL